MHLTQKLFYLFFFAALLMSMPSGELYAQTTTWNGSVSSDWDNPANWSNGVPTASGTARFNYFSASNHDPVISSNTTVGTLDINNFGRQFKVTVAPGVEVELNNLEVQASWPPGQIALDVADGHVTVNNAISLNGGILIDDGSITFLDDFTMTSSSYFNVETGTVNIGAPGPPVINADFTQSGGSTFNLNQGTLNIYGNSEFTGGGTFNAGEGDINLNGNIAFNGGSDFNADSSTVNMNGDVTISSQSNQDANFYNLNIEEGATVNSEIDVTVNNNMDVDENSDYNQDEGTNLNVVGDITGDPNIESPRPYIISIEILDISSIKVIFNQEVTSASAQNAGNYTVKDGTSTGSTIIDNISSSPVLGGSGNNEVTITFDALEIVEDVKYYLHVQNVENLAGQSVNNPHVKRFIDASPPTFYSRQNGNWASNSTWSTSSHTGSAATANPTTQSGAEIIIGDGHAVTVTSTATITNQGSVTVNFGNLSIGPGGTLTLGTDIISGNGTFEVHGGTLEIGSPNGITASGATGNIQTATRLFGTNGSYVYNGNVQQTTGTGLPTEVAEFEIDNSNNVRVTENLEVAGTLNLTAGSLIIQSGKNLIANTKNITSGDLIMEHQITGSKGWRLLSSPLSSTYEDLLDNTITQGYDGAYYSTGSEPGDTLQPNVMYYDETYATNSNGGAATDNQRWRAPSAASESVPEALGLYTYIFGDIDGDVLYDDIFGLPLTLTVQGQENEGNGSAVDFGVTYTSDADSGWNLVGNPYAATIDWDNAPEWTKTNIDNTIYVWDPAISNFKTWNGTTGDLDSQGLIAPFQGFWVKANGENPTLEVSEGAKTFGGTYVGKRQSKTSQHPVISLKVSDGKKEAATHFMFSEDAKLGKDLSDAYRLIPPPGIESYLDISSISANGDHFSINNLPRYFGKTIEIPIFVDAYNNGYSTDVTMNLSLSKLENIPSGWQITLIDNKSKSKTDLTQQSTFSFAQNGSKDIVAPNQSVSGMPKVTSKQKNREARFTLRISPGDDAAHLPNDFKLEQNYPNPFNPTTKIQFDLPVQSFTELSIFDMLGRRVTTLVQEELSAGTHTFDWDASHYSSGVYLYRLVTNEAVVTKKMSLIK